MYFLTYVCHCTWPTGFSGIKNNSFLFFLQIPNCENCLICIIRKLGYHVLVIFRNRSAKLIATILVAMDSSRPLQANMLYCMVTPPLV